MSMQLRPFTVVVGAVTFDVSGVVASDEWKTFGWKAFVYFKPKSFKLSALFYNFWIFKHIQSTPQ